MTRKKEKGERGMERRRLHRREEEEEERRRRACKVKEKGINEMRSKGIWVFMTKEEARRETTEQKEFWGDAGLQGLLQHGSGYRPRPRGLSKEEVRTSVMRAKVDLYRKVRRTLEDRAGIPCVEKPKEGRQFYEKLGLKRGTFKTKGEDKSVGLEEWARRWEQEKRTEVRTRAPRAPRSTTTVAWGGKTGKQLGLDPGPGNETAEEVRLWARHLEAAGVEAVEEARQKEKDESGRGESGRFKGEYGLPAEQERALKVLMGDPRRFAMTTADKGGGVVLISKARETEESRKHVLDESAYKPLKHFTDRLGKESLAYEGAGGQKWSSMLDWATDKAKGEEGEWVGEEGVRESLFKRMETLLDQELGVEMPARLKQGILMQEKDADGNVKPNEEERGKTRLCKMKMIVKVHKMVEPTVIVSRPVGRAAASQMGEFDGAVAAMVNQVLEDAEETYAERRPGGGDGRIILTESRQFVAMIDEINVKLKRMEEPGGRQWSLMVASWDVSAMYPSLKRGYIIKEIDQQLVDRRERQMGEEEKKDVDRLRKVLMRMLIFGLEHQLVSVDKPRRDGARGPAETEVFWGFEGVGIGSRSSGAIANLTLLGGEREMLEKMRGWSEVQLLSYKRYIDDIAALAFIECGREQEVFEKMQAELNNLDEAGGSVKVEGKFIAAGVTDVGYRCSGKTGQRQLEREQGIEFLDILIEMGWEEGRRQMITGVFRKKAAADLYLEASSSHPKGLQLGIMKGERIRFMRVCNREEKFEAAWHRYSKAMTSRGHAKQDLRKIEEEVRYSSRPEMMGMSKKRKREGPGLPLVTACRPGMQGWMDRLKVYGMRFEGLTELTKEFLPPRMFRCLTRTENLGEIIGSGGNRKSNDNDGGNEGLWEEEDADEPQWSGGMVGESVLEDMELEARLREVGEEVAHEAGGR